MVYTFNDAHCTRTSVDQAVHQLATTQNDISSRVAVGEQVPISEVLCLMDLFWKAGIENTRFLVSNVENEWALSGRDKARELVIGPLYTMDRYERIWAAQPDWLKIPEIRYSHDYDHLGWPPLVPEE
ncbi:MAG: hypothetical protein U1G05_08045 [Kiritimatiellia bacterium]